MNNNLKNVFSSVLIARIGNNERLINFIACSLFTFTA